MSFCGTTALKVNNITIFETKSTLDVFKNYYSILAENLLKKLPIPTNRYIFNSVIQYYWHLIQTDAFRHRKRGTKVCKAAGIDDLSCRFLKDGSQVLSKPISEVCNFLSN